MIKCKYILIMIRKDLTMDKHEENELANIIYKLTSMTFVLEACCKYYAGERIDTGNFSDFTKLLHETALSLLNFL